MPSDSEEMGVKAGTDGTGIVFYSFGAENMEKKLHFYIGNNK